MNDVDVISGTGNEFNVVESIILRVLFAVSRVEQLCKETGVLVQDCEATIINDVSRYLAEAEEADANEAVKDLGVAALNVLTLLKPEQIACHASEIREIIKKHGIC